MNIKHTLTWALLATLLSASTPADIKFTPAETQQISISTPGLFDKSKAFSIDFTSMGDRAYSFPLPVGKATLSDKEDRLEITSKKGDAVKAMFDGCVRLARKMDRHGNVIVIRHDNGLETVYENNAQNLVQSGQTVKAGQTIAIIGNDGEQGLCRFFIMVNGSRVNPTTIVNARNHRLYRQVLAFEKRGANIRITHIEGENNEYSNEMLEYIHINKTGALIIAAIKAGLYLGNPSKDMLSNLDIYSENLGLAYQIADDILDEIGDPKELGKAIGSDKKQHKNTYTSINGLEAAFARLEQLTDDALEAIAPYYDNAEFFRNMALQLKTRKN